LHDGSPHKRYPAFRNPDRLKKSLTTEFLSKSFSREKLIRMTLVARISSGRL
jgi:hypothetical protein